MFLVEEPQLIKVNFKPDKSDFANDNYYKQLYIGEISWCRKNTEITLTIHPPFSILKKGEMLQNKHFSPVFLYITQSFLLSFF